MMLKDIVEGRETSECVLIEDSVQQNGRSLIKSFLCNLASRVDQVHVVSYEIGEEDFLVGLPDSVLHRTKFHDGTVDPLGWNSDPSQTNVKTPGPSLSLETDLCKYLLESSRSCQGDKVAVVMDSISSLVLHRSAAYTCQVLHKLACRPREGPGPEITQVVALVHGDMHDDAGLKPLHHTSSSILRVAPPVQPTHHALCSCLHKKVTGKIIRLKEHFTLGSDFGLCKVEEYRPLLPTGEQAKEVDPGANLTFNLSLTDKEKEARSRLVLPYMIDDHRKEATLNKSVGAGKIFYQPDEADDFDEEDPDDDLDI